MSKIKNLKIMAAFQAIIMSGVTLCSFTSCKSNTVDVADNIDVVSVTEDDVVTTAVSDITKVIDSITTSSSNVSEIGETTAKMVDDIDIEDIEETIVTTTGKSNNYSAGEPKKNNYGRDDDGSNVVTDYYEDSTTKASSKVTTAKSTTKATTVKSDTTTKVTTAKPVTTKATSLSTKPVTTTTTYTEPVTEPVTEATTESIVDPIDVEYDINEICYNPDAFIHYALMLCHDFKTSIDGKYYSGVGVNGQHTGFYEESIKMLVLLNYGYINDDVISSVFQIDSVDIYNDYFINNVVFIQSMVNSRVDFEKYTCDACKCYGQKMNEIENSYFDGSFDDYIEDQIINGNIEQGYLDRDAIKCYFAWCDENYVVYDIHDAYDNFKNDLLTNVFGNSYVI